MKRSDNMEQILAYIDAHPDKNITVGELAALSDYSFYHSAMPFPAIPAFRWPPTCAGAEWRLRAGSAVREIIR